MAFPIANMRIRHPGAINDPGLGALTPGVQLAVDLMERRRGRQFQEEQQRQRMGFQAEQAGLDRELRERLQAETFEFQQGQQGREFGFRSGESEAERLFRADQAERDRELRERLAMLQRQETAARTDLAREEAERQRKFQEMVGSARIALDRGAEPNRVLRAMELSFGLSKGEAENVVAAAAQRAGPSGGGVSRLEALEALREFGMLPRTEQGEVDVEAASRLAERLSPSVSPLFSGSTGRPSSGSARLGAPADTLRITDQPASARLGAPADTLWITDQPASDPQGGTDRSGDAIERQRKKWDAAAKALRDRGHEDSQIQQILGARP